MGFIFLPVSACTISNNNVHFWLITPSLYCLIAADNDEVDSDVIHTLKR